MQLICNYQSWYTVGHKTPGQSGKPQNLLIECQYDDQPRKPLSLKPKASTSTPTQKRSRKRIIRRDELPAAKLTKAKPPPKPKPKKKLKPAASQKPTISPSDIRLDNLNASLNAFEVWRDYQPLTLGIEKALFQHIAKHSLSASKRVVQRLLRQHTRDKRYLQGITTGAARYHLDGTPSGPITRIEQDQARRLLTAG